MAAPTTLLSIAHEALDTASELARTNPPGVLTPKGDRDYASEVDFTIERAVRSILRSRTPGIAFVGEEENTKPAEAGEWWTLDPIDGTVNFAHSLPLCAVSLALIRDGLPVLGVIDLPFLDARYWAATTEGAHRNGHRLHVRSVDRLDDAVLAIGDYAVGPDADEKNRARLNLTSLIAGRALRVRMLGSAAIDLAWLAEGRVDASVTLSNHSWDVAAGVILAREAGATVLDQDGSGHTANSAATIATTPGIKDELISLLVTAVNGA